MLDRRDLLETSIANTRTWLDEMGFAVLDDVFSAAEVAEVETILDGLWTDLENDGRTKQANPFVGDMAPRSHVAGNSDLPATARQPELRYAACFRPELLRTSLFQTCQQLARMLGGNISRSFDHAIYKPANNQVSTAWHQDHAYLRLKLGNLPSRLNFWIPLQDATLDNGCMLYVPGAHRKPLKHMTFARQRGEKGLVITQAHIESAVPCPVRRGGLTIHTPLALHAAGPNTTDKPRKAWIIQFSPFGTVNVRLRQFLGRAPRPRA